MRSLNLYYVYDNLNGCAITPIIPMSNDLAAAIGFRDSYITNEEFKKKGLNYKALDLVRFGRVNISEDDEFYVDTEEKSTEIFRILGKDIMDFIKTEMSVLGIDDEFIEESE